MTTTPATYRAERLEVWVNVVWANHLNDVTRCRAFQAGQALDRFVDYPEMVEAIACRLPSKERHAKP